MAVNLFLPQVTRIPISGPQPYNTLVCVSIATTMGPQVVREGKLSRFPQRVYTPFKLAGFDQRTPPQFQHSTTASISAVGPFEDGHWLVGVDSVIGSGFDPVQATYYVDVMVALSPSSPAPGTCTAIGPYGVCFYWATIQITSFVLCYEPPPPPPPSDGRLRIFTDTTSLRPALEAAKAGTGSTQEAGLASRTRIAQMLSEILSTSLSVSDAPLEPPSGPASKKSDCS